VKRGQYRNHLLLVICTHTALRVSDILRLEWGDVFDEERDAFRSHAIVTERKTGKRKAIALHPKIIAALRMYYPHRRGELLFAGNRAKGGAIGRVQAWRILRGAAQALKLGVRVTCHGLRKSFGYHAWRDGESPVVLMAIYNHSSYEVTRRYLGVAQDDLDRAYLGLALFA
jgi:integrase